MPGLKPLLLLVLLLLDPAEASQVVQMKPWLVGLTAVVCFLFIVFVLMLVNHLWCSKERPQDEENSGLRMQRVKEAQMKQMQTETTRSSVCLRMGEAGSGCEETNQKKEEEKGKKEEKQGHTNEAMEKEESSPQTAF